MFNHTTLEQDIKRLSQEVAEKKAMPEHRDVSDKELIKRTIEPIIKEPVSSGATAQSDGDQNIQNQVLPQYLQSAPYDLQLQVEELIDVVFHKGVEAAVSRARGLNNPFILDALHDALVDKLYDELKERKLI